MKFGGVGGERILLPAVIANKILQTGQRLLAALISYQVGHAGVDSILKRYANVKIKPEWDELAMKLLAEINQATASGRTPEPPKWIQ